MSRSALVAFGAFLVTAATFALGATTSASAHGGGLNHCGCHHDRSTGECHCHHDYGCGCDCQPDRCED